MRPTSCTHQLVLETEGAHEQAVVGARQAALTLRLGVRAVQVNQPQQLLLAVHCANVPPKNAVQPQRYGPCYGKHQEPAVMEQQMSASQKEAPRQTSLSVVCKK